MDNYTHFEHLSATGGVGIVVLDTQGQTLFESSLHLAVSDLLLRLHEKLDCVESSRVAFLYACYQARRFGGRYIFFAPSALAYCAAPLLDNKGQMVSGVLAGPFLMNAHEEYLQDLPGRALLPEDVSSVISQGIRSLPYIEPKRVHSLSEHLYYVAAAYAAQTVLAPPAPVQTDLFSAAYPIEKEGELLTAISKGDIHSVNVILDLTLKQIMFHCGGNLELLRSRVVELTVLLSRAALKGGADINAVLGLNYDYLREIDGCSSVEDIVLWLHTVTRQFTRQVFEFSGAKHRDIIYKAVDYIKRNHAGKLTLQAIADHLYISRQYFCRIFKEETGHTPGAYITFVRIEESKKLLSDPTVNIIDIPAHVGLESQSYFNKIFKLETGITPGQYRREHIGRW